MDGCDDDVAFCGGAVKKMKRKAEACVTVDGEGDEGKKKLFFVFSKWFFRVCKG